MMELIFMGGGNRGFGSFFWIMAGSAVALAALVVVRGDFGREAVALLTGTLGDTLSPPEKFKLAAEIDLRGRQSEAEDASLKEKSFSLPVSPREEKEEEKISETASLQTVSPQKEEKKTAVESFAKCNFYDPRSPTRKILLNEIAWMGGETSPQNEWLEIKNQSGGAADLNGWRIMDSAEEISIDLSGKILSAGEFSLLERTDDESVPSISADKIYRGSLSNEGLWLRLFDRDCRLSDEIDARDGWPGGENAAKKTLERNISDLGWHTSLTAGGTPRAANSEPISSSSPALGGGEIIISSAPPAPEPPPPPEPAATSSAAPRVLLSEILYDAEGSDTGKEFVELYNAGTAEVNLKDWSLIDTGGSLAKIGAKPEDKLVIKSGGYFLVGFNSWDSAPSADAVRSASLVNTAETITLKDASGGAVDSVSYVNSVSSGQSFERISWDSTEFAPQSNPNPKNSQN